MKEIKIYEIELAELLENEIEGITFIVSSEGDYIAYVLDEYFDEYEELIKKTIQNTGYCIFDYQINDVK